MSLKTLIKAEIDRLREQKDLVVAKLTVAQGEVNALKFQRDQINGDIDEAQAWLDVNGG